MKIYNHGLPHLARTRTCYPDLPIHRQTHSLHQQQGESPLHSHHTLHLPRLLSDPHLWCSSIRGQWSLLLDESHLGIKQRYFDVVGSVPSGFSRLDPPVVDRYRHNITGFTQPPRGKTLRRLPKVASNDNSIRLSLRLHLVRSIRLHIWHWSRKCDVNSNPIDSFRIYCDSSGRYASKRVWFRFRNFTFHSS